MSKITVKVFDVCSMMSKSLAVSSMHPNSASYSTSTR